MCFTRTHGLCLWWGPGARDWSRGNKAREGACKARSEEYDSPNPLYLRVREVMQKKDSIHTSDQTLMRGGEDCEELYIFNKIYILNFVDKKTLRS